MKDNDTKAVADAVRLLAHSVLPAGTTPGRDAAGHTVDSLIEAVMGVTAGLCRIAEALESVAAAIRERDGA